MTAEGRTGTGWFEPLYAGARRDAAAVPWARLAPDPQLLAWLDQPDLDVDGSDALVVGCGLGDDAAELARRGCRVTAIDLSQSAVDWATERHAAAGIEFRCADLLDLPQDLVAAAGLVVEIRTVQSLNEPLRADAMRAIASTVAPGGVLLHVGLVATSPRAAKTSQGPPWAISPDELAVYEQAGLERMDLAHPAGVDGESMEVVLTMMRPA
ncbi:MAG: SAM-dependent methyltransferase [Myxococcota bacterium]|jgi:SAM-dependent methyltransferase